MATAAPLVATGAIEASPLDMVVSSAASGSAAFGGGGGSFAAKNSLIFGIEARKR